jgi:hypothetical protein
VSSATQAPSTHPQSAAKAGKIHALLGSFRILISAIPGIHGDQGIFTHGDAGSTIASAERLLSTQRKTLIIEIDGNSS